jgi:valyl-tRNA synthetase
MLEKTFQPEAVEAAWYNQWEKSGIFAGSPESNRKPFAVMMPPPNVTGSLHMGHALNMTLQDILTRYWRMRGRDALWQPGTDHAGIATQMVVERMLEKEGQTRRGIGRKAFLDRVWEWKEQSGGTIVGQLRRLGATPDWARERFTMDEGLSKAVRKVFVQLYREKLIYRDKRLVNWDPKLHTSISDLEVEQKDVKGHMWHIRYPIEGLQEEFITVATTRPETLLGDTAIAVNPEDERYKHLVGKFAVVPIANRPIPIVADDYADPEHGSGAVKITPAHDFNDFEVGRRHNLPMINVFDISACLNDNVPEGYKGLDRDEARKKILRELEEMDLLVKVESIKHTVPHGDRSGVIIEPFLTDQWYVDAKTLAQPAIEAVRTGKTEFVPKQWENTYFSWMEDIQPWCISRQLWWGHQIPAWYGPNGTVYVAETEAEAMAEAREAFGSDIRLERDPDVLDTWFSSALWPFSTLGWPDKTKELDKYYPGDVLVTGFDIIFFWVARMMMMGLHFMGDVPFKTVYMHALVRDAKGQKMSKSKGNVIDPLELIGKYGTDALRFTLTAMAAQGRDIKLSEDRVEGYRNFGTKLWNAARYCQMNGCVVVEGFDPAAASYVPNQWIVGETVAMAKAVATAIEAYKFNEAASAIYHFVWGSFCDWYLEFTKPILSPLDPSQPPSSRRMPGSSSNEALTAEGPGVRRDDDKWEGIATEIRATTAWVLDQVLTILNPVMPFFTEELYAQMAKRPEGTMLITSPWPDYPAALAKPAAMEEISWLTRLISAIRSVRSDMNVPAGAKIALLVKDASAVTKTRLEAYDEIICRLARLEKIELIDGMPPKGSIQTVLDEATLAMPIAAIIDLDKERARLAKEIDKLSGEIKKIDQKLSNDQFVQNAPEEIITEQKQRRSDFEASMRKFSTALKQLEAA